MRACIVGGGLAGSLLAWRLARASGPAAGWDVELAPGDRGPADATAASGGAVRAYEQDPAQRRLATQSLVELLASRTLRRWADFREGEAVCLSGEPDGLPGAVAEIDALLPGSAELVDGAELARAGWAGLPDGAVAVRERRAGYLSPGRLRDALLADCAGPAVARRRVSVRDGRVRTVVLRDDGRVRCGTEDYDLVVLAAGAWTPALLAAAGLPADGYRTKAIQYVVHRAGHWRPPQFVDGVTGLFGRPTADGGLLLGLPTEHWDVEPGPPAPDPALPGAAAELVRARFPALRLGPAGRPVAGTDCYAGSPGLSLRRVVDTHPLFTFTGGAGGSAKTALAASSRAVIELARVCPPADGAEARPTTPGPPAGAPTAGRTEGRP
ncbi:MAG: NAD(P)/FAD-dependent oxidoreductase [Mycobacteriales bacterium]